MTRIILLLIGLLLLCLGFAVLNVVFGVFMANVGLWLIVEAVYYDRYQ